MTTGAWVYRLGRRCAADFIALPAQVLRACPAAPHYNPAERIWGALKNYVANTAVSWPGRLRQIHKRGSPPVSTTTPR